jgi:hypothetical protein
MPDAYVIEVFGRTAGSHVAQSGMLWEHLILLPSTV